jgi:hypothetical protein
MSSVTLRAHFDGERIRLDEPFDLEPDAELLVTVLPSELIASDREGWSRLAGMSLAQAYGDDEPEYPLEMVKEANPEYEGR